MPIDARTVSPVNSNAPRDFINTNPLGSDFASTYSLTTTYGLQAAIDPRIISVIPNEFGAFKWYSTTSKKGQTGKEWNWFQGSYPNTPFVVRALTVATAAVPGTQVQQIVLISDISIPVLAIGTKVVYPNNQQGTITAISRTPGAATATVDSMISEGLPATAAGDILANHGTVAADGTYSYDVFHTTDLTRYSNIMEMFYDAIRWDRAEVIQLMNQQQLPLMEQKKKDMMFRAMARNEAALWLGQYGMNTIPANTFFAGTGYRATYTRGILQHMTADGVATINTTTATAMDDIKQVIWDNSLLANTKKWLLYATSEKLEAIGIAERSERVRYTPGDSVVNTEVTGYKMFNGHMITPIACDAWKDVSYYGNILRDDAILIPDGGDEGAGVSICYMNGYPLLENTVHDRINDGQAQFHINVARGMWGVEVRKAFVFGRFHFLG